MQAIEDALQQFFTTNGRLPFPARAIDSLGSEYYLSEYKIGAPSKYSASITYCDLSVNDVTSISSQPLFCSDDSCEHIKNIGDCSGGNIAWGIVPTRTLGLPDDYAYDSYGHNFEYIIDNQIAFPMGFEYYDPRKKANYTTSKDGRYQVFYQSTHDQTSSIALDFFDLSIVNDKTNQPVNNTIKNTAYVLLSKGKADKCFWDNKTANFKLNTTIPNDNTKYNCQANYSNGEFEKLQIYQGYSKSFDNLVRYKTISELVTKSASMQEDIRNLGTATVAHQLRTDDKLQTTSKEIVGAINELLGKIYPVGSVYISVNNTDPSTIFGGTWVQVKDRFLLASTTSKTTGGASGSNFSLARTKNVAVTVNGTALTIDQMPSHNHNSYTSYAGNHKHASPYRENAGSMERNPFGAIYKVYDRSAGLYGAITRDYQQGVSSATDSDNALLLTSKPLTYDDYKSSSIFDELVNYVSRGARSVYVNGEDINTTDAYGNHRHYIESVGKGASHGHTTTITQPEFNMPPYFTVYVWYRTA